MKSNDYILKQRMHPSEFVLCAFSSNSRQPAIHSRKTTKTLQPGPALQHGMGELCDEKWTLGAWWQNYLMVVCRHHFNKSVDDRPSGELVVWSWGAIRRHA
jgi:hypothetical protein